MRYIKGNEQIVHDAGLIDLLLNQVERSYWVSEVLDLIVNAGLQFQTWVDNGGYYPNNVPLGGPVRQRIERLAPELQWAIVERLTVAIGTHSFVACRPERASHRAINFDRDDWLNYYPARHPLFVRTTAPAQSLFRYSRAGHRGRGTSWMDVSADIAVLIDSANGQETAASALAKLTPARTNERRNIGRSFYSTMWQTGHMFFSKVPT